MLPRSMQARPTHDTRTRKPMHTQHPGWQQKAVKPRRGMCPGHVVTLQLLTLFLAVRSALTQRQNSFNQLGHQADSADWLSLMKTSCCLFCARVFRGQSTERARRHMLCFTLENSRACRSQGRPQHNLRLSVCEKSLYLRWPMQKLAGLNISAVEAPVHIVRKPHIGFTGL